MLILKLKPATVVEEFEGAMERALNAAFEGGWNGCTSAYTDVLERKEAFSHPEQDEAHAFVSDVKDGVLEEGSFEFVESDTAIGFYLKLRDLKARTVAGMKLFLAGAGGAMIALVLRKLLQ